MPVAMRAAVAFDASASRSHSPSAMVRQQLRGGETHLRPDLAGPAKLDREAVRQLRREHHDRVAQRAAVLGRAERQDVDARPPGKVRRAAPQPRHRVGKARAVHMHLEAAPLGQFGDRAHLVQPVDRAEITRLGQVDRRRLAAVRLAWHDRRERLGEGVGADAAVAARHRNELDAAAEEPGGIDLGDVDVGKSRCNRRGPMAG